MLQVIYFLLRVVAHASDLSLELRNLPLAVMQSLSQLVTLFTTEGEVNKMLRVTIVMRTQVRTKCCLTS